MLEPPLTPPERNIIKSYGGWTNFMLSYTLKLWKDEDVEEALQILRGLTGFDDDASEDEAEQVVIYGIGM